jgi:capsular polysaccharide biosynthesis protein/Flp pilus assembly protein TadD
MTTTQGYTVKDILDAAEAEISRGSAARAEEWLSEVAKVVPGNPRLYHLGGLAYRLMGRENRAIGCLRKSLILRPFNPAASTQIAVLIKARGELWTACKQQYRASVADPMNPDILYNLANALNDIGYAEDALLVTARASELAPLDPYIYRLRAAVFLSKAEVSGSVQAARKSVLLSPMDGQSYLSASTAEWESGNPHAASTLLEHAFLLSPLDVRVASNRIRFAVDRDDPAAAVRISKQAVIAAPGSSVALSKYCAGYLEENGEITRLWRAALCAAGQSPETAGNFAVYRVVKWDDLAGGSRGSRATITRMPDQDSVNAPGAIGRFLLETHEATVLPRSQVILTSDFEALHEGVSPFAVLPELNEKVDIQHWNPNGGAIIALPTPAPTIPKGVLLGMSGSGNYYHWLIDFLPRLFTINQFRDTLNPGDTGPYLASDNCPEVIRELLGYLGVDEAKMRYVPYDRSIAVEHLFIPALPSFSIPVLAEAIAFLKTLIEGPVARWSAGGEFEESGTRVYLDRRSAVERRVLNEDALISRLRENDFTVVSPDPTSIRQQILGLAKARVLVSAHGAGMANMIFAPPGCEIIELGFPHDTSRHISNLARACGHRHRELTCKAAPQIDRRPGRRDLDVPLTELSALLSTVLD